MYAKNFEGFEELFGRFVNDKGHGLVWDDISPPPEGLVRAFSFASLTHYLTHLTNCVIDFCMYIYIICLHIIIICWGQGI